MLIEFIYEVKVDCDTRQVDGTVLCLQYKYRI